MSLVLTWRSLGFDHDIRLLTSYFGESHLVLDIFVTLLGFCPPTSALLSWAPEVCWVLLFPGRFVACVGGLLACFLLSVCWALCGVVDLFFVASATYSHAGMWWLIFVLLHESRHILFVGGWFCWCGDFSC